MDKTINFLKTDTQTLAYTHYNPNSTKKWHILFLSGYHSDMMGTKASFMAQYCMDNNITMTRFDYSGHGQSSGEMNTLCLSDWIKDTYDIIRHLCDPQKNLLVIGSSMGAWIGLKILQELKNIKKIAFIGLAAAPDFTSHLMPMRYEEHHQKALAEQGYFSLSCDYDEDADDYVVTQKFLDDGDDNAILNHDIILNGPVHLLQGKQDKDVPFQHVFKIAEKIIAPYIQIHLINNGDHRLSTPDDLETLLKVVNLVI